jgi:tetratricopeptide (TPR) repeat protein
MAEHWLYIPMIGLSLAFGAAMDGLSRISLSGARLIRLGITASAAVFLFFAALVAMEKTKIYQSDEVFLAAAIRANPHIARLYSLLGNVYFAKENFSKAKGLYSQSLSLDPRDFVANYMLGQLLYQEGRQEEAKIHLQRIISINPSQKLEFSPVAHAWEMLGERDKALFYFRKALQFDPESTWIRERIASLEAR